MSNDQKVIAELRKNRREVVRVTIGEFKGSKLLGLRVWYQPADGGELRPGRDGLALKLEHLSWLQQALAGAQEEIDRRQADDGPA